MYNIYIYIYIYIHACVAPLIPYFRATQDLFFDIIRKVCCRGEWTDPGDAWCMALQRVIKTIWKSMVVSTKGNSILQCKFSNMFIYWRIRYHIVYIYIYMCYGTVYIVDKWELESEGLHWGIGE